ncbi:MAG TPA: flavohemoglobin expression-modulating QEGLA motif protein [Gammaproteobacteria bacterium]|nr:flavohemoglobin expression-modulating QEGLA motif protein [Gammaproteobacteria bacterium]
MTKKKVDENYLEKIRKISDAVVKAQMPIRILDIIKWPEHVKHKFFENKCKQQPEITVADYHQNLKFDIRKKAEEFLDIEQMIIQQLGQFNTVGGILRRMCQEYSTVLRMLNACGTSEFSKLSKLLYGSPKDVFHEGDPTITQLGSVMASALTKMGKSKHLQEDPRNISAEKAVAMLQTRLNRHFHESDKTLRVLLDDGIISDAAAGADYIKIRQDAWFNKRDIRILEVHEGFVHIATTLNGKLQPYCTFLSKGPPSSTITQEGLAVLMEIISLSSFPARLKKIANRIRAIELAEDGATFLEVFNYFRQENFDDETAYVFTARVFRGSLPTLGPFTKDLSYSKGFVTVYNFLQLAIKKGELHLIPLLFCGKTKLEDLRDLYQLQKQGIVKRAKFLPPQIKDLNAICAWMCFTSFINTLTSEKIESDYDYLFSHKNMLRQ